MKKLVLVGVFLLGVSALAQYESMVHTSKLGPLAVAVTCRNGNEPVVDRTINIVVISCAKEGKK